MPTKKPRITVTLTDEQYKVLRSISDASGQPMSGYISDLIEAALPTAKKVAVTMQQIRGYNDEQRDRVLKTMDEAQSAFEPLINYLLEHVSGAVSAKQNPVCEERSERAKKDSAEAVTTSTNRGVTGPCENIPKPRRVKGLKQSAGKKVFPKS